MPGKIKVKILAGRNLPVMDRSGDTTDAYVEIKFGTITYKTDVCRKSLNPQWNSEWYRFEVDDAELQDEPLQIRLMDYDTYSANDAIGKVYINLNPLLLPGLPLTVKNIWTLEATMNSGSGSQGGSVMTGWIPVFDTMHGIRGEVNVIVKVELFSDFNKFKQSSCGVQFFYSKNIPHGYHAQVIHGFVEELIVSDDPEYKWIDKIRTPRASNEARQTLFFKLSGEVQRKIGLKALDLGGNAVIGYVQNFDLEGESGIVARGIGTAVTLVKLQEISNLPLESNNFEDLACLTLQCKNPYEYSDSDDSLPLLSYSPKHSPLTPIKIHHTQIGNKFPKYDRTITKYSHPTMKIIEYKSNALKNYQMQSQGSPVLSIKKTTGSNLSLTDELISEASLKTMLALEDMRGERTSALSRGLKNLRHFPRRIKSKISDSFDDESDQDSSFSSTLSIIGSDSARSSLSDIRQNIRKKRYSPVKSAPENLMASLLIRSVHSSLPLDSVREDRETPTPSPVNILNDQKESARFSPTRIESINEEAIDEALEELNLPEIISTVDIFDGNLEQDYNYDQKDVPMISSSETDTSTSEDFESSSNYNALDDSFSAMESSVSKDSLLTNQNLPGNYELKQILDSKQSFLRSSQELPSSLPDFPPVIINIMDEIEENAGKAINFNESIKSVRQNSIPEGLILDLDFKEDEICNSSTPLLASTLKKEKSPLKTSPSFKLKHLGKQNNFDDDINFEAIEKDSLPLLQCEIESISGVSPKPSLPLLTNLIPESNLTANLNENTSIEPASSVTTAPLLMIFNKEENFGQMKGNSPWSKKSPLPYKKYLMHSGSLECKSTYEKSGKIKKKIRRTQTVIYKGPLKDQEKVTRDTSENDEESSEKESESLKNQCIIAPEIIIDNLSDVDTNPQLSMSDTEAKVAPLAPDSHQIDTNQSQEVFMDPQLINERFIHKFRQHCMVDLIKIIDSKMMTQSPVADRKDSTRSRKKRKERNILNLTPSPDSIRKTGRSSRNSKSPEKHHHHHHHHHHHTSHHHQLSSLPHSATHSSLSLIPSSSSTILTKKDPDYPVENQSTNNNLCLNNSQSFCSKDKLIINPLVKNINDDNDKIIHDLTVKQLAMQKDSIASENIPLNILDKKNSHYHHHNHHSTATTTSTTFSSNLLLNPDDLSVHKCHSDSNIGDLNNYLSSTKITNMTDDQCVPCLPLSLRHQEDLQLQLQQQQQQQQQQQTATSPIHQPSVFPSSVGNKVANTPATKIPLHRRSSDSDLSITPKGNSLASSDRSMGGHHKAAIIRTMNQLEMLEYPFITLQQYPPGFLLHLGGLVSARSVKLIERITNLEEPEGRDAWWKEIRMEVRSHARALGCNVVLGYKEEISICDDVCVLNAFGTAAVINLLNTNQEQDILLNKNIPSAMTNSMEDKKLLKNDKTDDVVIQSINVLSSGHETTTTTTTNFPFQNHCNLCHLPYSEISVPFKVDVSKCAICKKFKVPDVLFTTIELPDNIPMTGRGILLQATVCKSKRDLRAELNAKEISDCLPFLEYELHSLLLNKLKVKGMNAIFGLKIQISVGERFIVGMAVGTAVFLTALPTPSVPKIASGNSWHKEEQLAEIQKTLIETVKKNRELYRLKPITEMENGKSVVTSDTDDSDDDLPALDLSLGLKDACVLEVDDIEDMDRINLLIDEVTPEDFLIVNTQTIPGLDDLEVVRNLQMFTQISRSKIPSGQFASMPSKYFARILQTIFFKLRRMVPCALCDMQFKIAIPEQDEIQISVVGMALGLGELNKMKKYKRKGVSNSSSKDFFKKTDDNDLIFNLEEDQSENPEALNQSNTSLLNLSPVANQIQRPRPRSPFKPKSQHRHKHVPLKERYGVDLTPLSYLPGGKIERYLGNLNFFFIRESTSIRENGGLSGFTHSFITEILAIVRAHITALGGNGMVAFFLTQCVLLHSPHKNQGQCLINVGGDVVSVSYFGDEKHNLNC